MSQARAVALFSACHPTSRTSEFDLLAMTFQFPNRQDPCNMQSLFVTISCRDGVLTIKPAGPKLAEREAMIIAVDARRAVASLGKRLRRLVLDMSAVQVMSSFGLGMCIELRNSARLAGAATVLFGLTDELKRLFELMRVDHLYTIAQSPNELAVAMAA
jgi:anti-anti-sigma factor